MIKRWLTKAQNWDGLRDILAPKLLVSHTSQLSPNANPRPHTHIPQVDYAKVNNAKFVDLPAEKYIEMMSDPLFLGDPLIVSQHLIGATKWEKISDEEVVSHHQSRAAHQRWADEQRSVVAVKGHGHGVVTTFYKKLDGVWKWAGIRTKVIWNEYDFEHVFIGKAGKDV